MLDAHHIGGFIQNTIKPLIEELDSLLATCKHLKIKRKDLEYFVYKLVELEIEKVTIQSITWITLGVLGCLTTYFILH